MNEVDYKEFLRVRPQNSDNMNINFPNRKFWTTILHSTRGENNCKTITGGIMGD